MRDFFKEELKTLHIKTGLQQYFKLSEMENGKQQITLLLDELVTVCTWFPNIPDDDKKEIISRHMITDPDLTSLNKKIIWKWLNMEHPKYIPNQSQFVETTTEPATPEVAEKYLNEWNEAIAKMEARVTHKGDGIKDQRIQKMKEQFGHVECKHSEFIEDEKGRICMDCGKEFLV